jgi:DNA-binding CsgD family transcriptional regulator
MKSLVYHLYMAGLTTREIQVACLVAGGLTSKAVAAKLLITEPAVKFHLTKIYRKTKQRGRPSFVYWAGTLGKSTPARPHEKPPHPEEFKLPRGRA